MITPWRQTDASPTGPVRRYQWTSQSAYGFLNPDIALLKAFSVNAAGLASCTRSGQGPPPRPGQPAPPPECKDSATAGQVRNFANDNTAFMNAIGPVLTKVSRLSPLFM